MAPPGEEDFSKMLIRMPGWYFWRKCATVSPERPPPIINVSISFPIIFIGTFII
jgi:hypothetical protein